MSLVSLGVLSFVLLYLLEKIKKRKRGVETDTVQFQQLMNSHNFLNSLIEHIPSTIYVKKVEDLTLVKINRAGEFLLGCKQSELIGKNDFDLFPPEQAKRFRADDRQVISSGNVLKVQESSIQTINGERQLRTTKIPILNEEGKPTYLLGIAEDVTEKNKAELQSQKLVQEKIAREAAEKNAKHFAFLSSSMDALSSAPNLKVALSVLAKKIGDELADWCLIDILDDAEQIADTIVIYGNESEKLKLVEDRRARMPTMRHSTRAVLDVLESNQPKVYSYIDPTTLKSLSFDHDHLALLSLMNMRSVMIVPMTTFHKVFGTITYIMSNPNKKISELDLALARDLAKRASLEIDKARLYESAQTANLAKTAFLANMSHEIRTPLGAIIGYASLIQEIGSLSEEQVSYTNSILRNSEQLLKLVNELLDVSKIESEHLTIIREEFSIENAIEEVINMTGPKAKDKNLNIEVEYDCEVGRSIISDSTRIKQILINLIGNSIKFTMRGSVTVRVEYQNMRDDGGACDLVMTITDTGIGIDPKNANLLFKPFSQIENTINCQYEGTGLGLHLSKKLAIALGGDLILLRSQVGEGSVFRLTIPVGIVMGSFNEPKTKSIETNLGTINRPLKILVVDDSSDMRFLVVHALKKMGHHVEDASSGTMGIEMALSSNFDIIFLDMQMPGLDGFETLTKIRELKITKPIVALTAHAMKGDREKYIGYGFDYYMAKPVRPTELKTLINQIAFEKLDLI